MASAQILGRVLFVFLEHFPQSEFFIACASDNSATPVFASQVKDSFFVAHH